MSRLTVFSYRFMQPLPQACSGWVGFLWGFRIILGGFGLLRNQFLGLL